MKTKEKIYSTLIRPVVTEKSSRQQVDRMYTFEVPRQGVTKIDIKKAVEEIYGVNVEKVRVIISPRKTRNLGRRQLIKRNLTKKAIVTVKKGQALDFNKISNKKK